MPSLRQIFFTTADEKAFSDALKERFPDIRFATRSEAASKGDFSFVADIPSAGGGSVRIFIPPVGWKPEYYKLEFGADRFGISNYPEEWMSFRSSSKQHMERGPAIHDYKPLLGQGSIQVGGSDRMTAKEKSFRNKVWRVVSKIATPKLKALRYWDPEHQWTEIGGQIECAGWDAVRWALDDERRVFAASLHYRPADGLQLPASFEA